MCYNTISYYTINQPQFTLMLITNNWKEYELLDAGDGMKLERWGHDNASYILARPDPTIIWPKEQPGLWIKADAIYTRSNTGLGKWDFKIPLPEKWEVQYKALRFSVHPTDFKHMGLFPEQAVNWDWMMDLIYKAKRSINVLNLFAYTGAATIACLTAGAKVCHVDASKGIINWAKENAQLNGVGEPNVRFIIDDVLKFVEKEKRRGIKYDAIIMDPPSYGRGTKGETWKIEKMLWPLVASCRDILSNEPLFFLINSYTTGLGTTVIKNVLESAMIKFGGKTEAYEIVLPISESKKLLPAGVCGRWQTK